MNAYQSDKIVETPTSIYAYDMSIVEDLRTRFNRDQDGKPKTNNKVYITSVDNVFNIIGDLSDDKINMPLISLQRNGWSLASKKPQYMIWSGYPVKEDYDNDGKIDKISRIQAIPITINYQLDVWTRDRITNDAIMREIIFYYTQRPTLLVKIPYGLNYVHDFNIFFDNDIEDNSDIVEHVNRGQFFRQTVGVYTDDAYLWKSRIRKPATINAIDFTMYDGVIKDGKEIEATEIHLEPIIEEGDMDND